MYNDFMDGLEYAAGYGCNAVCVNDHHSNGYWLMPAMNLITSSLERGTSDTAKLFAEQVQAELWPLFSMWEHRSQPRSMANAGRATAPAYPAAE